jgi:hypothetical protein
MFNINQLSPMKKVMILMLASIVAAVAVAQQLTASIQQTEASLSSASFTWVETVYDFGKIQLNVPVTHEFTFTNTGSEALVISSVKASCGCTVAEYSKDPIPAGGKGFVKATYNAAKAGMFTKTVTINANVEGETVLLTIKGEVIE